MKLFVGVVSIGLFALGWWLGRQEIRPDAESSEQSASSGQPTVTAISQTLLPQASPAKTSTPLDRLRSGLALLEQLELQDLPNFLMLAHEQDDTIAMRTLSERWAALDPVGMLEFLESAEPHLGPAYVALFDVWAVSDPERAVGAVETIRAPLRQTEARCTLIPRLLYAGEWDLAFGQFEKGEPMWSWNGKKTFQQLAEEGLLDRFAAEALAREGVVPLGPMREEILSDLLAAYQGVGLDNAIQFAKQLSGRDRFVAYDLLEEWGKQDPAAALEYGLALPTSTQRNDLVDSALQGWVSEAPDEAWSWIKEEMTIETAGAALQKMVKDMANEDPLLAIARADDIERWIGERPTDPFGPRSMRIAAYETWLKNDAPAYVDWLKEQPAETRDAAIVGTAYDLADDHRALAQQLVESDAIDSPRLAGTIAEEMAEADPAAALEWSLGLSDEAERTRARNNAVLSWAEERPVSAVAWLEEQDPALIQDIFPLVANRWGFHSNRDAMNWVRDIHATYGETFGDEPFERALGMFYSSDETALESLRADLGLTKGD